MSRERKSGGQSGLPSMRPPYPRSANDITRFWRAPLALFRSSLSANASHQYDMKVLGPEVALRQGSQKRKAPPQRLVGIVRLSMKGIPLQLGCHDRASLFVRSYRKDPPSFLQTASKGDEEKDNDRVPQPDQGSKRVITHA